MKITLDSISMLVGITKTPCACTILSLVLIPKFALLIFHPVASSIFCAEKVPMTSTGVVELLLILI